MTLEELNARIAAIDDCHDIIFELYVDSGCDNMDVVEILDTLLQDVRKLRYDAWNELTSKIDELSKQA